MNTDTQIDITAPPVALHPVVRPLRNGEVRLKPADGHTDIRNNGDQCFGHPGVDWCETCGAVYGTPEWRAGCVEEKYDPLSTCCGEPPLGEIEHGICRGCRDHCQFDGTNNQLKNNVTGI